MLRMASAAYCQRDTIVAINVRCTVVNRHVSHNAEVTASTRRDGGRITGLAPELAAGFLEYN
jgi:hypothetical protein